MLVAPSLSAIAFSVEPISVMPASEENCAICATICVLSTGSNGSWFFICAVISFRKSAWPSELDLAVAVFAALVAVEPMPRFASVVSKEVAIYQRPILRVSTMSDLAVFITSTLFW